MSPPLSVRPVKERERGGEQGRCRVPNNLHTPTPHMRKASFFLREESPLICLSVGRVVDVQQSDRRGVARGRGRQRGLAQLLGALQVPRVAQRGLDVGREGTWLGHR